MPVQKITIDEFINLPPASFLLLDVRSPSEFKDGHIPLANNLPLFIDEERKVVGTAYKQQSREHAIKIGLTYFGTKMTNMLEQVEALISSHHLQQTSNKNISIVVHCWRGGMRSAGVAWLLDLYGFTVYTIMGGYKSYRNWVLQQFGKKYNFKVVGGYTGSGKTEILQALQQNGQAIIDFEKLARHKGSAFGNLNNTEQPSQEMFENKLATELYQLRDKIIFIEDESQRIGTVNIPASIHQQKQQSNVYFLDIPFEERLQFIISNYGKFDKEKLINAIIRIKKKLGGLETKNAINFLLEDDTTNCFSILLKYYDKFYLKGLYAKENIDTILKTIPCNKVNAQENTSTLLNNI